MVVNCKRSILFSTQIAYKEPKGWGFVSGLERDCLICALFWTETGRKYRQNCPCLSGYSGHLVRRRWYVERSSYFFMHWQLNRWSSFVQRQFVKQEVVWFSPAGPSIRDAWERPNPGHPCLRQADESNWNRWHFQGVSTRRHYYWSQYIRHHPLECRSLELYSKFRAMFESLVGFKNRVPQAQGLVHLGPQSLWRFLY